MNSPIRPDGHATAGSAWAGSLSHQPTDFEIDALIEDARRHPLGLEFLRHGQLGSVAMIFHAHALTVDAARDRLSRDDH